MSPQQHGRFDDTRTMPGIDAGVVTRYASDTTAGAQDPAAEHGAAQRSSRPSFGLSSEALRNEERGRLRVTAQVLLGLACMGLLLAPVLGGDPFARRVFVVGLSGAVVTMGLLLRNSYRGNYNVHLIGAGCVSLALAYTSTLYYFGSASQAAMTGALGLYIFCLGSSTGWSAAVYAAIAGPHALLAALILAGVIADRALVKAGGLPSSDQIALQCSAQALYAIAFVVGRKTHDKLKSALKEVEATARLLARRDALLNEAKQELERVARTGEGRFSDQVVGSYRLGNVIGRGGMGEVYHAVHLQTDEPAAVKLLHRHVACEPASVARFAREALAASSFDSPYVVRVLEVSDAQANIPYLTMERLRGEDLASILRREQQLSPSQLVELLSQVGRGLDEARKVGVIHRDIKPQNLFLARRDDGSLVWKILDFGVSKLVGQGTLTQNKLIGTPDYMAPEQASGGAVDHRTDLYALAAVLYRCVAARPPFVDSSLGGLLNQVISRMPARPSGIARVSSDVEAFLAIGLAKEAADRFESGEELAEAFQRAVKDELPMVSRARAQRILERTPWT